MSALLRAFNNTTDIAAAMRYGTPAILDLFGKMKKDHKAYGIDEGSAVSLPSVIDSIGTLCAKPPGEAQPFLRPALPVKYHNSAQTVGLGTLFDLVGWVFSVAGPAPQGATRENYFYPVAGLYGSFVGTLVGRRYTPHVMHMTWYKQADGTRILIGANLDNIPSPHKHVIREERFDQLASPHIGLCTASDRMISHVNQPNGMVPQYFGSCAETIAFMHLHSLKLDGGTLNEAQGFSAKTRLIIPKDGPFDHHSVVNHFVEPCENCKILLQKIGLSPAKFSKPPN